MPVLAWAWAGPGPGLMVLVLGLVWVYKMAQMEPTSTIEPSPGLIRFTDGPAHTRLGLSRAGPINNSNRAYLGPGRPSWQLLS